MPRQDTARTSDSCRRIRRSWKSLPNKGYRICRHLLVTLHIDSVVFVRCAAKRGAAREQARPGCGLCWLYSSCPYSLSHAAQPNRVSDSRAAAERPGLRPEFSPNCTFVSAASGGQMLTLHVRFLWRRSGLAVDPHPEAFFELSHLGVVEVEDRGAGCGVAELAGGVVAPTRTRACRTTVPTSRNTAGVTPGQPRPAQRRRRDTSAARAMSGSTPKSRLARNSPATRHRDDRVALMRRYLFGLDGRCQCLQGLRSRVLGGPAK